jgi:hypothetical protein
MGKRSDDDADSIARGMGHAYITPKPELAREQDYSRGLTGQQGGYAGGDVAEAVTIITAMLSAAGGMKMLLEMVKLWIEARKERRIKLKRGDIELEIQGSMSEKEIQESLELFLELSEDAKDRDVTITVPRR